MKFEVESKYKIADDVFIILNGAAYRGQVSIIIFESGFLNTRCKYWVDFIHRYPLVQPCFAETYIDRGIEPIEEGCLFGSLEDAIAFFDKYEYEHIEYEAIRVDHHTKLYEKVGETYALKSYKTVVKHHAFGSVHYIDDII